MQGIVLQQTVMYSKTLSTLTTRAITAVIVCACAVGVWLCAFSIVLCTDLPTLRGQDTMYGTVWLYWYYWEKHAPLCPMNSFGTVRNNSHFLWNLMSRTIFTKLNALCRPCSFGWWAVDVQYRPYWTIEAKKWKKPNSLHFEIRQDASNISCSHD